MISSISRKFSYDWVLIFSVLFILSFSFLVIYSFSFNRAGASSEIFFKQVVFFLVGIPIFIFFSLVDYRNWKGYGKALFLLGIGLLIAVLFWGKNIRGATGWFDLGFFNFQPAEIMKVFFIIVLARYFSRFSSEEDLGWKQVFGSLFYLFLPALFLYFQPDMGSVAVLVFIWFLMIFLSGIKLSKLVAIILIFLLGLVFSWTFVLKDYHRARIESFLNPNLDPKGSGYNVIQSMVAVGSGGISGKGYGYGSQSQLNFLPEQHTDFIFAMIAEEGGLIGSLLLILTFWLMLFRINRIMNQAVDQFGFLFCGGVLAMMFFQIVVNIGMNLGVMPVAGLALPFLSYGGSHLLVSFACLGIVQNIWIKRRKEEYELEQTEEEF